jgi:putative SOS response-associated peptidase YedK
MEMCRALALQESKALRGYALAGERRPYVPVDLWAEWQRIATSNGATFKAAA